MTAGEHSAGAIEMSNAAAAGRIEEDYANSAPYQHAIELLRNPMQQRGTTTVIFDIVKWPATGALKRFVSNDGPSMTQAQMERYMATIGEGNGDLWRLDNTKGDRHAGARTAVLPFTDLGILSWDSADAPDGLYMKLYMDPIHRDYRYTEVTVPSADQLNLLINQPAVRSAGHGVGFVFLGRDEGEDGPYVDPNPLKGETDAGIANALRDRVYAIDGIDGNPIRVTVNYPMPVQPGTGGRKLIGTSSVPIRLDGRTIEGLHVWGKRTSDSGTLILRDIEGIAELKVHWTLLPFETKPQDRRLPFNGGGHIGFIYKNETMVLAAGGDLFPDLPKGMRKFGLQLADVYNRTSLIIEGPTDPGLDPDNPRLHFHQDPSRSRIMMSNGREFPIDAIGDAFIDQMPAAFTDANRAARERIGKPASMQLSVGDRISSRLASRLKAYLPSRRRKAGTGVQGPSGLPGTDYLNGEVTTRNTMPTGRPSLTGIDGLAAGGTTTRSKRSRKKGAKQRCRVQPDGLGNTRQRRPGHEGAANVVPRPVDVPEPVPLTSTEWEAQGFDPVHFASWDHASGWIYFNLGHQLLHAQISYFSGEWLESQPKIRRRVTSDDVREAVRVAYFEDTVARVMHYATAAGPRSARTDLTDLQLTIAAYGLENVEAKIIDEIRTLARRGVVNPGEAA